MSAFEKLQERIARDLASIDHCDPDRLTDDQRFALAVTSGVRWELGGDFGTTPVCDPCAISHDGEKWVITSERKPQ